MVDICLEIKSGEELAALHFQRKFLVRLYFRPFPIAPCLFSIPDCWASDDRNLPYQQEWQDRMAPWTGC